MTPDPPFRPAADRSRGHRGWTRPGLRVLLALAWLAALAGYSPDVAPSMPAARQALRSEYRFFYDALTDYGDWVLIEPFGYVFRPDVNFVAWRPYTDGYWVPTDIYGWVWVSNEPFGWATYHYGEWGYDRFQGWVWLPGAIWGPAWVDWRANEEYAGWAPLMPPGTDFGSIPGGAFVYVPTMQLPSMSASSALMRESDVGQSVSAADRVRNPAVRGGVTFNRGPSIEAIERLAGPLPRARVDDLVPSNVALDEPSDAAGDSTSAAAFERDIARAKQAGERAAREAKAAAKPGGRLDRLPVVRPFGAPDAVEARKAPPRPRPKVTEKAAPASKAPADSAR